MPRKLERRDKPEHTIAVGVMPEYRDPESGMNVRTKRRRGDSRQSLSIPDKIGKGLSSKKDDLFDLRSYRFSQNSLLRQSESKVWHLSLAMWRNYEI
jgi:hypothetical protein